MTAELHRPLSVARIPPGGLLHEVRATAEECAALATRMAVPGIHALSCGFTLRPEPGGAVRAEGQLRARLVRVCVVSLEPFDTEVAEDFTVRFVPAGQESDDPDPESVDEIGYAGGEIDLGEAAAEQLGLALDPYPRRPDAVLPEAAAEEAGGPFAALARRRPPGGR
ncbi:MAG: DUF177 domain-containing protein [Rhodospirillales bacterium]|nr:DUF177 domain-containing protein [Rhodospirillales bacterium]MDE2200298.1 DUF177 domain-containing protein [Rhodospirillales bacterium]MDE2574173.1 DUF177 domain-containing protein [Rhodospirillales bacterium]